MNKQNKRRVQVLVKRKQQKNKTGSNNVDAVSPNLLISSSFPSRPWVLCSLGEHPYLFFVGCRKENVTVSINREKYIYTYILSGDGKSHTHC